MPIPVIAAVLSAIAAPLAAKGLELLSGIFKGATDKAAREVEEFIQEKTGIDIYDETTQSMPTLTDEQWVRLKEFESQYQDRLMRFHEHIYDQNVELERLRLGDVEGARSMHKLTTLSEDRIVKRFPYYLATGMIVFTALYVSYASFLHDFTDDSRRVVDTVLGFMLGVGLSTIIQFFFGSSQGSVQKQQRLDSIAEEVIRVRSGAGEGR